MVWSAFRNFLSRSGCAATIVAAQPLREIKFLNAEVGKFEVTDRVSVDNWNMPITGRPLMQQMNSTTN